MQEMELDLPILPLDPNPTTGKCLTRFGSTDPANVRVSSDWFNPSNTRHPNLHPYNQEINIPNGYSNANVYSVFLLARGEEAQQRNELNRPAHIYQLRFLDPDLFTRLGYFVNHDPELVNGLLLWRHYTIFAPIARGRRNTLLNELIHIINETIDDFL